MKAVYFDMDGTIADLYGVSGWLDKLQSGDATPYATARPLVKLNTLARKLNTLQRDGYTLGIVSWLAKNSDASYDQKVTEAKKKWLNNHLKSVKWDEMHIVKYGTPKEEVVNYPQGILFDDEDRNRNNWSGKAYKETEIMEVLNNLKVS